MAEQLWHGALAAGQFAVEYPMPAAYAYAAIVGSLAIPHYFPDITTIRRTLDPYPINSTDINNLLAAIEQEDITSTQDNDLINIMWRRFESSTNKKLPTNVADCEVLDQQIQSLLSLRGFAPDLLNHINCTAHYEGYQAPVPWTVPGINPFPTWLLERNTPDTGSDQQLSITLGQNASTTTTKSITVTETQHYKSTGSQAFWRERAKTFVPDAAFHLQDYSTSTVTSLETVTKSVYHTKSLSTSTEISGSSEALTSSEAFVSSTSEPTTSEIRISKPVPPIEPDPSGITIPSGHTWNWASNFSNSSSRVFKDFTQRSTVWLHNYIKSYSDVPWSFSRTMRSKLATKPDIIGLIRNNWRWIADGNAINMIETDTAWMIFHGIATLPGLSHATRAKWCHDWMGSIFAPNLFVEACSHSDTDLRRAAFRRAALQIPNTSQRNWQRSARLPIVLIRTAFAVLELALSPIVGTISRYWHNIIVADSRRAMNSAAGRVAVWFITVWLKWRLSELISYPESANELARSVLIIAATIIVHSFLPIYARFQTHSSLAWYALLAFIAWSIRVLYANLGGFCMFDIVCFAIGYGASEIIFRFTKPRFGTPSRFPQFVFNYIESLNRQQRGWLTIEVPGVLAFLYFLCAPAKQCPYPKLRVPLLFFWSWMAGYHCARLAKKIAELPKRDRKLTIIEVTSRSRPLWLLTGGSMIWATWYRCLDWNIMIFAIYLGARIGYSLPTPIDNEVPLYIQIWSNPGKYVLDQRDKLAQIQRDSVGSHFMSWHVWSTASQVSTGGLMLSTIFPYYLYKKHLNQCRDHELDRWPGVFILASIPTVAFILRLYFRDHPGKHITAMEGPIQYFFWIGLFKSYGVYYIWTRGWGSCVQDIFLAISTVLLWSLVGWNFGKDHQIGSFWNEFPTIPPNVRERKEAGDEEAESPGVITAPADGNHGSTGGFGTLNTPGTRTNLGNSNVTSHGLVTLLGGSRGYLFSATLSGSGQPDTIVIDNEAVAGQLSNGQSTQGNLQEFDPATAVHVEATHGQPIAIPGYPHVTFTHNGPCGGDEGGSHGEGSDAGQEPGDGQTDPAQTLGLAQLPPPLQPPTPPQPGDEEENNDRIDEAEADTKIAERRLGDELLRSQSSDLLESPGPSQRSLPPQAQQQHQLTHPSRIGQSSGLERPLQEPLVQDPVGSDNGSQSRTPPQSSSKSTPKQVPTSPSNRSQWPQSGSNSAPIANADKEGWESVPGSDDEGERLPNLLARNEVLPAPTRHIIAETNWIGASQQPGTNETHGIKRTSSGSAAGRSEDMTSTTREYDAGSVKTSDTVTDGTELAPKILKVGGGVANVKFGGTIAGGFETNKESDRDEGTEGGGDLNEIEEEKRGKLREDQGPEQDKHGGQRLDESTARARLPSDLVYDPGTEGVYDGKSAHKHDGRSPPYAPASGTGIGNGQVASQPPLSSRQGREIDAQNPASDTKNDAPLSTITVGSGDGSAPSIPALPGGSQASQTLKSQSTQDVEQNNAQITARVDKSEEKETPQNRALLDLDDSIAKHVDSDSPISKGSSKQGADETSIARPVLSAEVNSMSRSLENNVYSTQEAKHADTEKQRSDEADTSVKQSNEPVDQQQVGNSGHNPSNGPQEEHLNEEGATFNETVRPRKDGKQEGNQKLSRRQKKDLRAKERAAMLNTEQKGREKDEQEEQDTAMRQHEGAEFQQGVGGQAIGADFLATMGENHAGSRNKLLASDDISKDDVTMKSSSTKTGIEKRPDKRTRDKEKKAREEAEAKQKREREAFNRASSETHAMQLGGSMPNTTPETGRKKPIQHHGGQSKKHSADAYREKHGMSPYEKAEPGTLHESFRSTLGTKDNKTDQGSSKKFDEGSVGDNNDARGGESMLGKPSDGPGAEEKKVRGLRLREKDFLTEQAWQAHKEEKASRKEEVLAGMTEEQRRDYDERQEAKKVRKKQKKKEKKEKARLEATSLGTSSAAETSTQSVASAPLTSPLPTRPDEADGNAVSDPPFDSLALPVLDQRLVEEAVRPAEPTGSEHKQGSNDGEVHDSVERDDQVSNNGPKKSRKRRGKKG